MKLIVAGSRDLDIYNFVELKINQLRVKYDIKEIVSGGAKGVDSNGKGYAKNYNLKYSEFLPDWEKYGNPAGPIRNRLMAEYGDILLAFHYNNSPGTKNMINNALANNLKIYVVKITELEP